MKLFKPISELLLSQNRYSDVYSHNIRVNMKRKTKNTIKKESIEFYFEYETVGNIVEIEKNVSND